VSIIFVSGYKLGGRDAKAGRSRDVFEIQPAMTMTSPSLTLGTTTRYTHNVQGLLLWAPYYDKNTLYH
jgi:hypothetical protein